MDWIDSLRWPVLRITEPKGIMIVCKSPEELLTARYIGIAALQRLRRIVTVDCDGLQYSLTEPKLQGAEPGVLWKLMLRLINPRVQIEYGSAQSLGRADLSEVKKTLAQNVRSYSDFWMEMDVESPDELIGRFDAAQTIEDLIAMIEL